MELELERLTGTRPDYFREQTVSKIGFAHTIGFVVTSYAGSRAEVERIQRGITYLAHLWSLR